MNTFHCFSSLHYHHECTCIAYNDCNYFLFIWRCHQLPHLNPYPLYLYPIWSDIIIIIDYSITHVVHSMHYAQTDLVTTTQSNSFIRYIAERVTISQAKPNPVLFYGIIPILFLIARCNAWPMEFPPSVLHGNQAYQSSHVSMPFISFQNDSRTLYFIRMKIIVLNGAVRIDA